MMIFRNRFALRTICTCFIFLILNSSLFPGISYAITLGPTQPEFTSYEEPGAADMVNMGTGDFTFSLPVLEVPGPEGGFSLPLTYNGGIGLDQEASWVGLGWTMNAGAITRSVNQFPDDANGESQVVTVQDLTGLRGWNAGIRGIGKFGWNNQVGHFGNLSILGLINANWTNDFTSVGIAGINVTSDGMNYDVLQMQYAIFSIMSIGSITVGEKILTQGVSLLMKIAANDAYGTSDNGGGSMFSSNSPNAPTDGYWEYSEKEKKNWWLKIQTAFIVNVNEYKIWLDKTRTEDMYGSLYAGNAPTTSYSNTGFNGNLSLFNGGVSTPLSQFQKSSQVANKGAASDITYIPEANEDMKQFYEVNNPVTLAYDNYSVKAPGVSGSIIPYRLEIGSVSMPREMTSGHERLATLPFLSNTSPVTGNYKVPFIYNGQLSNSYFHHVGSATAVTSPAYYLGVSATNTAAAGSQGNIKIDLNDVIFKNERIKSSIPASKKIPQSRYIEWHTNDEIRNGITYGSRYLDFLSGGAGPSPVATSDRYKFRTDFPGSAFYSTYTSTTSFSTTIPIVSGDISKFAAGSVVDLLISFYADAAGQSSGATLAYREYNDVTVQSVNTTNNTITFVVSDSEMNSFFGKIADIQVRIKTTSSQILSSIGSFIINGPDGTAYHFGIPLYDYDNNTEIRKIGDNNKRSIIRRSQQYATAWLLTAITGPDFIDRSSTGSANGFIDESDWGSWVKFNYGRHIDNYEWRFPYAGYKKNPAGTHESYTSGKNHLYYLNSIETRSHVALFQKSLRADGKSAKTTQSQYPLRLDEISLITREQYKKLIASHGMTNYSDKVTQVLLGSSLSASAINYIKANCAKRVVFTYDYTLCNGVLNSSSGKLTLARLSILGKNDLKAVPDYKFEYGYNPAYNVNHWDGYGMYNPNGTDTYHDVSPMDLHGSAWSLTKVTNPLGSEIIVNYERDDYSLISGDKIVNNGVSYTNSDTGLKYFYPVDFPANKLFINHNNYFAVGDVVRVDGFTSYLCPGATSETFRSSDASRDFTITEVGSNYIKLDADFIGINNCGLMSSGQYVEIKTQYGVVGKVLPYKKGGEVRAASIVIQDAIGISRKIRYLYTNDNGTSSGVISSEPQYVGGRHVFYDIPGYPQTPVMYGKVSVLTGPLTNDTDFDTKQTFEFETPHQSLYTVTQTPIVADMTLLSSYNKVEGLISPVNNNYFDYLSFYENKIEDRTSKIGRLKAVKIYDKNGALYSSSDLLYTDSNQILNDGVNNYQGVYSNGALMFDRVFDIKKMDNVAFYTSILKMNRTTKLQFPGALLKTINYKDGFTSESTNLSWDLYTGNVLSKSEKSPLGVYLKTVTKPAYTVYGELGPRALAVTNKNMLSQSVASYSYRTDASGNVQGLTNANVTTWNKTWANYRVYNPTTQLYADNTDGADVWRKGKSYVFKGDYTRKNADGTLSFLTADDFNFTAGASNLLWQYTGEFERFDHYGMPVQTKDLNSIYAITKMGYDNTLPLMSASNAKYTEAAFSSAEDLISGAPFFGGEVGLGSGSVLYKSLGQVTEVHTGDAAVSLAAGYSFIFKPTGLSTNKNYRAVVWTNSTNGRIYYKLNGGVETLSAAPTEFVKIGPSQTTWYRINRVIPIGSTFTSLEVGVKSATGTVLFDDFRFQPLDGGLTGYVYNVNTKELEYVLDNDNVFTKYEYNDRGQLVKTYREILKYNSVKLVSQSNNDFKRFHTNQ